MSKTYVVKQNKIIYYFKSFLRYIMPNPSFSKRLKDLKLVLTATELEIAEKRVNYYCKLNQPFQFSNQFFIKNLKQPKTPKTYYFDCFEYARYFNPKQALDCIFGDVVHVPDTPHVVKSRPIVDNNSNSILINLDKARHFVRIENDQSFLSKKDLLIGRFAVYQKHRADFFESYFGHPLCDLGQVNKIGGKPELWLKPKMPIIAHLDYKFVLSLQGNDVATNLKWIMSSNSIAVMPKPTVETWYMEATLIGGVHYIEVKPDYTDLIEQLKFYINHPNLCLEIIQNAQKYHNQFFNQNMEDYCSLRVLEKCFQLQHDP